MGVLSPSGPEVAVSRLGDFMRFCEAQTGERFADHGAFHDFSVRDFRRFWSLLLRWSGLLTEGSTEPVCTDDVCERATFFPELRLSYVENLVRADDPKDAGRTALIARHASRPTERLTRRELRDRVRSAAAGLTRLGLGPGDRAAAVAANNAEAVIAGLATTAVGATFSSAGPDMGVPALLSRFEQLEPTVLFANLRDSADDISALAQGLPTLTAVVALDDGDVPPDMPVPVNRLAGLWTSPGGGEASEPWPRFPFNHPLFVLFTSGTTGPPKCIVHGAGGTLLEHAKEHRLHVDLRPEDRLFFHTSAGWMMWNWQLSALATGCAIVLYDGPLESAETLWRVVAEERVTVFGTSPPYLQLCEDRGFSPRDELRLPDLRAVLSTGSVLHDWQYDWIRDHVGPVPVRSISGGTDIIGCFVLGNPELPVRRGWIQCRSLGMDVQALATADSPSHSAIGELVCRNPFPSRPLGFLGDDGARFHEAYFEDNPGVWTHGDLIEFDAAGQARIHGRTDGVINVQAVRIGPAEIYRALRGVPELVEALAVEQRTSGVRGQSRLVLLVVLRPGTTLDGRLTVHIRREIARNASPFHVPDLVVQVGEVPITHSGKRSERAARDAVNGSRAANREALSNPQSLEEIRRAVTRSADAARALAEPAAIDQGGSTEARVTAIWESVIGVAPLRPDDDFFDLGGTSLLAAQVLQAIHDQMGIELPLSTPVYARTPAAMAAVIDGPAGARVPTLVLLRPGPAARPLFLVHSLWGDVITFRPLALALDTDRPIYGLQARGLDPSGEPHNRVEDMAATYVDAVRAVQPEGPYAIAGYSLGGLIAFEMARILTRRGDDVEWLGLIDPDVSHHALPRIRRWLFVASRPLDRVRTWIGARTRIARYRRQRVPLWARLEPVIPDLTPLARRVQQAGWEAFREYRPAEYAGDATFLASTTRDPGLCDPLPVWRRVVRGGLSVERLDATHAEIMSPPLAPRMAQRIAAALHDARDPGPTR